MQQPERASTESIGAETIEQLFAALESPLLNYAWRLTGARESAEDLVQEAFMRLHAQFKTVEQPRRWLYRTVHNLALNQRRAADKIVPLVPEEAGSEPVPQAADPQLLPDEEISRLESIGLVRLGLAGLDERGRELLRLKFAENLSYKEISARTGLTTSNVGYLLHHLLKELGDELARNGLVP